MRNTKFTKKELLEQVGSNFSLLLVDKEEITANEEISPICNICGRIFRTTRRKLVRTDRCPTCGAKKRAETKSITFEEFEKKAIGLYKNHYSYYKDFYINASTNTLIRCNWCGNVFQQKPQKHLNGNGCIFCNINRRTEKLRKSENEVIENIKTNLQGKFTFIKLNSKYTNNLETKATVKCNICGLEYSASVNVLAYREVTCKNCANVFNLAEEKCKMFLYNKGVKDIRGEVKYKDLIYKDNLRFDIFLPEYMTAIEIQGWHHYKPYKYSSKQTDEKTKFEEQKIKDQLKREWCIKHNVNLIEIPYYKVRRNSSIKKIIDEIKLVRKKYSLSDLEDGFNKFVLTEKLKTILK